MAAARDRARAESAEIVAVSAKLEAELGELPEEDAAEYLAALGLPKLGADRVIQVGYRALNLISFLTAGEDEVRAWTMTQGMKAPAAAGKIHTDFERGFIRAEVVHYDDLLADERLDEDGQRAWPRPPGGQRIHRPRRRHHRVPLQRLEVAGVQSKINRTAPSSGARSDEYHHAAGAGQGAAIPVAIYVLHGESGVDQGVGQFCLAAKSQLATRNHDLTCVGKDVVACEADPIIAHVDQFQPALHRPERGVDPLVGGVARPAFPRAGVGVAALEGKIAARTQGSVDGAERRGPLRIIEEHLGHIASHDHQVGCWRPQRAGVPFNPVHSISAWLSTSDRQHCGGRIDANHIAAIDRRQLASQQARPAPQVENPPGVEVCGETKVEVGVGAARIIMVVKLDQARIHVVLIKPQEGFTPLPPVPRTDI